MNYIAKVTYLRPVENSDKIKRYNEQYLVNALSVTEAEARVKAWAPANFQDVDVKGADKVKIADVNRTGESQVWWLAQVAYQDIDGFSKPFTVAVNGDLIKNAINDLEKLYITGIISGIKTTNIIFEEELLEKVEEAQHVNG